MMPLNKPLGQFNMMAQQTSSDNGLSGLELLTELLTSSAKDQAIIEALKGKTALTDDQYKRIAEEVNRYHVKKSWDQLKQFTIDELYAFLTSTFTHMYTACKIVFRNSHNIDSWQAHFDTPSQSWKSVHSGIIEPRMMPTASTDEAGNGGGILEPLICTSKKAKTSFLLWAAETADNRHTYKLLHVDNTDMIVDVPLFEVKGKHYFALHSQVKGCTLHLGTTRGQQNKTANVNVRYFFSGGTSPGIFGYVRVPIDVTLDSTPILRKEPKPTNAELQTLKYAPLELNTLPNTVQYVDYVNLTAAEALQVATTHRYKNTVGTALQCIKQGHQGDLVLHEGP